MSEEYQSLFHKKVCVFFQYLSFVSVVVALFLGIADLWLGFLPKGQIGKVFVTTGMILVASFIIAAIFSGEKITLFKRK